MYGIVTVVVGVRLVLIKVYSQHDEGCIKANKTNNIHNQQYYNLF